MNAVDSRRTLRPHLTHHKRGADFIALLDLEDAAYSPRPGHRLKPVVLTRWTTGPGSHRQGVHRRARGAAMDQRGMAAEVRAGVEPHRADGGATSSATTSPTARFRDVADLEQVVDQAVADLNAERKIIPCDRQRIAA